MVDSLDGLRHHIVVGSDDNDNDVGNLSTAGTHSGESLVAGSIEESDTAAIGEFHVVGTDVLSDTTCLTGNHIGIADVVEQRSFTMIDVTHYGDDRRTLDEVGFIVLLFLDSLSHLGAHIFGFEAKFLGNNVYSFGIEALVDRNHHADAHTSGDNLVDIHVHHHSEVVGCNKFGDFQHLALCCFLFGSLALTFGEKFAFLLAPFRSLLLWLVGETSESLFNLFLYLLLVNFGFQRAAVFLFLRALSGSIIVSVIFVFATFFALRIVANLVGAFLDVDFLGIDAFALAATRSGIAVSCSSGIASLLLVDALLATLLLALLLGASLRINSREVDFAHYIDRETGFWSAESENFLFWFLGFGSRSFGRLRSRFLFLLGSGRRLSGALLRLFGLLSRLLFFRLGLRFLLFGLLGGFRSRFLHRFRLLFHLWLRLLLWGRCGRILLRLRLARLIEIDFVDNFRSFQLHSCRNLYRFILLRRGDFLLLLTFRREFFRLMLSVHIAFESLHEHLVGIVGDSRVGTGVNGNVFLVEELNKG